MLQIIGAALAVVSTSMDIFIDSTVAAKATLALMHLVVVGRVIDEHAGAEAGRALRPRRGSRVIGALIR